MGAAGKLDHRSSGGGSASPSCLRKSFFFVYLRLLDFQFPRRIQLKVIRFGLLAVGNQTLGIWSHHDYTTCTTVCNRCACDGCSNRRCVLQYPCIQDSALTPNPRTNPATFSKCPVCTFDLQIGGHVRLHLSACSVVPRRRCRCEGSVHQ